jgi:Lon protease-like protein
MADMMPIFPLSLVVFPGENINLHIFEPRYKQLLEETRTHETHFAIAPYFEGRDLIYATEVRLEKTVKLYPNGKSDITLKGLNVVKIIDFFPKHPQKLYPAAEIIPLTFTDNVDVLINMDILQRLQRLYAAMNIQNINLKEAQHFRCSDVGHKVGFSIDQEFEFMLINNELDRSQYMLEHLNNFIPQVLMMEELRKKAQLNGHFQNIKSPF